MVIVIMGVSGCGKTTVGKMLAKRLDLTFLDADDFHSSQSIEKMESGMPLDDRDRASWLQTLAAQIAEWNRGNGGAVLACSALKESYRRILTGAGREPVTFVFLEADRALVQRRLAGRSGHFFHPDLLQSQFDILEIPSNAIKVLADQSPEDICGHLEMLR